MQHGEIVAEILVESERFYKIVSIKKIWNHTTGFVFESLVEAMLIFRQDVRHRCEMTVKSCARNPRPLDNVCDRYAAMRFFFEQFEKSSIDALFCFPSRKNAFVCGRQGLKLPYQDVSIINPVQIVHHCIGNPISK